MLLKANIQSIVIVLENQKRDIKNQKKDWKIKFRKSSNKQSQKTKKQETGQKR